MFLAEELEHLNKIPHPHAEKLGDNHYHEGEHNADFDHQVSIPEERGELDRRQDERCHDEN